MPVSSGHESISDAPALVVGEVQVQHVELQQRDRVEVAQHVLDGEEVPGDVEHRAAVGEARGVGDGCRGHGPSAVGRRSRHPLARSRRAAAAAATGCRGRVPPPCRPRCARRRRPTRACSPRRRRRAPRRRRPRTRGRMPPARPRRRAARTPWPPGPAARTSRRRPPRPRRSATSRDDSVSRNGASSSRSSKDVGAGMMPVTASPFCSAVQAVSDPSAAADRQRRSRARRVGGRAGDPGGGRGRCVGACVLGGGRRSRR